MRPLIFIVDDDPAIRRLLEHVCGTVWEYRVATFTDGVACLDSLDRQPALVVLDLMMEGLSGMETLARLREHAPDVPVIILSAQESIDVAVETMRHGAHDYFTKPVDIGRLEYSVRNALTLSALREKVRTLQETLEKSVHFDNIITGSGAMENVLRLVDKACASDITVLILGESGTGKEMIARALHFHSKRREAPFIVVNCAAIPADLLESELFGHERGAFTGAMERKIGKFEAADGGTIFLDEIGELPLPLQGKLLRALQTRQFERVGSTETLEVDVRFVSATNRDLRDMSARKEFREDLYYRLASFPVLLPPLRERHGDVLLLATHFLADCARREGRGHMTFAQDAQQRLLAHPWPGNVRELINAVERAVVLSDGPVVTAAELPGLLAPPAGTSTPERPDPGPRHGGEVLTIDETKERAVRVALTAAHGNQADAARRLDISRTTLYGLMRKYGIEARDYRI